MTYIGGLIMETATVKMFRDKLRAAEKNIAIRLYCDNGIIIDEGTMFVKWDDANNVILAIKSNEDQVNHMGVKIKTIIADYSMIQYLIAYSTHRSIKPIAKELGYSDEQIDNAIDKFDNIDPHTFLNTVPKEVKELSDEMAAKDEEERVKKDKKIKDVLMKDVRKFIK